MTHRHKLRKLKEHYINLLLPSEIEMDFAKVVGMENEKEALKDALLFLNNLKSKTVLPVIPHSRFSLFGDVGMGKSTLVYALAKEANVPIIVANTSALISSSKSIKKVIDLLFDVANQYVDGCVIHLREFEYYANLEGSELSTFLNHLLNRISSSKNTVIFLSCCQPELAVPPDFLTEENFSKEIVIMPPPLKAREELFEMYIKKAKLNLADDVSINQLACNTFGSYPKDIVSIVREVGLYTSKKGIEKPSMREFNEIILSSEAGETIHILSEKDKISTAYHEAGHVIAAYYSNPEYVLGRVEITPRASSLGLTQEETREEKYTTFKHDYINDIIYSLGGMAAEKLIYGETTSGVLSDLATANVNCLYIFQKFGMDDEFGPIVIDANAGFHSNELLAQSEKLAYAFLKEQYKETLRIVSEHRVQLEALKNALLEHEVLLGNEIKEILDNANENPPV